MRPNETFDLACRILILLFFALILPAARADLLDDLERKLSANFFHDQVRLRVSGLLDFEGYFLDQPAPGLIYSDDNALFNPRLTVFLDAQFGAHVYGFVQARVDRGFDPSDDGAQVRLDEYAISVSPWKDGRLNFKVGKFGTVVGNWVPRHYSWDNPFINAPLPYENLTGVWDTVAPDETDTLLYWAHVGAYESGDYSDKYLRNPVIWGPSYATGFSIYGSLGGFDYAVEMKNAALASRPESWDLTNRGLEDPTYSARLGFRPNEMWNFGVSASAGPYLLADAQPTLPPGRDIGDYREFVIGQDVSFAWHRFQFWAEVFESRFQVANVGNADTLSYYLEAKYKITAQLFAALRWNQQFFGTVRDEDEFVQWGNDISRIDAVLGYRFTEYLQLKTQYSYSREPDALHEDNHLFAGQLTFKF